MKHCLFISLIFILSIGCKKQINTVEPSEIIIFEQSADKIPIEKVKDNFFEAPRYIKLESENKATLFGRIDQVKIQNDTIYILDEGIKSLLVYGADGKSIGKVGVYGQGPREYLDIASFDVDASGTIYTIDGRLDKLFIYDKNFNYLSSTELPFEVDQIQVLENGGYMFALSSWNKKECEGKKIAVTDRNLKVLQTYFIYDEYRDDNYWISGYEFIKTNDYIIYNRPIDDHIHLFSLNGELIRTIRMDFGDRTVPDEIKKDIEKNLKEFENYCLLKNFTVITLHFILGTLWEHCQNKIFIQDRSTGAFYTSKKLENSDNTLLTGFCGSTMVSFLDPDFYEEETFEEQLPGDVIEHLKNGNFVISLRNMK